MHANLALALLLAGELDEAQQTAHVALARGSADAITHHLADRIEQVRAGRIPRPTCLSDLLVPLARAPLLAARVSAGLA